MLERRATVTLYMSNWGDAREFVRTQLYQVRIWSSPSLCWRHLWEICYLCNHFFILFGNFFIPLAGSHIQNREQHTQHVDIIETHIAATQVDAWTRAKNAHAIRTSTAQLSCALNAFNRVSPGQVNGLRWAGWMKNKNPLPADPSQKKNPSHWARLVSTWL